MNTVEPNATSRLHALDNLRALMMWLGIVLHVAVIYVVTPLPNIPWHDPQTTPIADLLLGFIHAFRMPMFFILAGFFVALMVQKQGAVGMLKNRLRRLGLPFIVFWLPVFATMVVFVLLFLHRMARGTWGLDVSLIPQTPHVPTGPTTMHLWFLWLLLGFSVLTAGVYRVAVHLPAAIPIRVAAFFGRSGQAWWGFGVLSLPLAWIGSFYANGIVTPDGGFLPPLSEWGHNGLFYLFGWYVYPHQQALFAQYTRYCYRYAVAGLGFFLVSGLLMALLARPDAAPPYLTGWIALTYNCATWLWCFALMGLFLRYLQHPNPVLGYLAESSYWVYIVHMPMTIGFGAVLYGLPLPALTKLLLNVLATTAVCLISYQLFVRSTRTGLLLNGVRKTPRTVPSPGLA
jgi:glucans biosynthesis protein C